MTLARRAPAEAGLAFDAKNHVLFAYYRQPSPVVVIAVISPLDQTPAGWLVLGITSGLPVTQAQSANLTWATTSGPSTPRTMA
jgi:hypothetical protein